MTLIGYKCPADGWETPSSYRDHNEFKDHRNTHVGPGKAYEEYSEHIITIHRCSGPMWEFVKRGDSLNNYPLELMDYYWEGKDSNDPKDYEGD